jgi:hypothetical protein
MTPIRHLNIKATREGLNGGETSSGYRIDKIVSFVALPAAQALHRFVCVTNCANQRSVLAQVLDVGPWNIADTNYVFGIARPAAESGVSVSGKGTNSAGIDLGEYVWRALGMTDNTTVDWEFVDEILPPVRPGDLL